MILSKENLSTSTTKIFKKWKSLVEPSRVSPQKNGRQNISTSIGAITMGKFRHLTRLKMANKPVIQSSFLSSHREKTPN